MPTLSILIPAYNAGTYISETIRSVINQTFADWELIIVDDRSTDNTYEQACIWAAKDSRIKVYQNATNLGMLENWNYGISLCHSPYFVKLDADDIWMDTILAKSMRVLQENENVGLVFTRFVNITTTGEFIPGSDQPLPDFARGKAFSCLDVVKQGPDKMLSYPILRQGLSVMRRSVFDKVGLYRYLLTKATQAATDSEFYFRVGAHYDIFCIDEVLYQYRVHNSSISALDASSFLLDVKVYETKYCIISYYKDQNLLPESLADTFLTTIKKQHAFSAFAMMRKNKQWASALKIIGKQAFLYPGFTTNFYMKRVLNRLSL
ncbi:glycosyltransferase family 2 protein [Hymenobacter sp. 5414T-23]|uniref:glycosyltransferase family 2 protein n=1 Tax=Hymenobacter sp. 5414T-23 TaxID=2932252 RepID=UPI001FD4BBE6|nr:glycosyltransferase family 2 protein [Hymenobacter sp. 5414T-23]UOQ82962.1 glycosyltransferase [Hymenobacter sp. 5414T-23]